MRFYDFSIFEILMVKIPPLDIGIFPKFPCPSQLSETPMRYLGSFVGYKPYTFLKVQVMVRNFCEYERIRMRAHFFI